MLLSSSASSMGASMFAAGPVQVDPTPAGPNSAHRQLLPCGSCQRYGRSPAEFSVMSASTEQQQLELDLHRVFALGGGIVTLTLLHTPGAMAIVDEAIRGDAKAKTIMTAAEDLLRRLEELEAGSALACTLCDAGALCCGVLPGGIGVLVAVGGRSHCCCRRLLHELHGRSH